MALRKVTFFAIAFVLLFSSAGFLPEVYSLAPSTKAGEVLKALKVKKKPNFQDMTELSEVGAGASWDVSSSVAAVAAAAAPRRPFKLRFDKFKPKHTFTIRGKKYEVIRRLGKGSFGAVYQCKDSTGLIVAIKVQNTKKINKDLLLGEIRALDKLAGNKNIVEFYDAEIGRQADTEYLFLVQEYIESPFHRAVDVAGVLTKKVNYSDIELSFKERLDLARQFLNVMREIHKQKIMHRDLKTENIMITKDAEGKLLLKVIDFGLALIDSPSNLIGGSPNYLSPEKILNPEIIYEFDYLLRSESFTVGLLIMELLVYDDASFVTLKGITTGSSGETLNRLRNDVQPLLDGLEKKLKREGRYDEDFFYQLRHLLEYANEDRLLLAADEIRGKLDKLYKNRDKIKNNDFSGLSLDDLKDVLTWCCNNNDQNLLKKILKNRPELYNDAEWLMYMLNLVNFYGHQPTETVLLDFAKKSQVISGVVLKFIDENNVVYANKLIGLMDETVSFDNLSPILIGIIFRAFETNIDVSKINIFKVLDLLVKKDINKTIIFLGVRWDEVSKRSIANKQVQINYIKYLLAFIHKIPESQISSTPKSQLLSTVLPTTELKFGQPKPFPVKTGAAMLARSRSAELGKALQFNPLAFEDNPAGIVDELKRLEGELGADKLENLALDIDASKSNKAFGFPDDLEFVNANITVILADQPGMAVNYRVRESDGTERLIVIIDKSTAAEGQTNKLALKRVVENELFQLRLKRQLNLWDNDGFNDKQIAEIESMSLMYLVKRVLKGDIEAEEEIKGLRKLLGQMIALADDEITPKLSGFSGDLSLYRNFLGDIIKALQPGAEVDRKKLERLVAFYDTVMNGYKKPEIKDKQASFSGALTAVPGAPVNEIFNSDLMNALRKSA